MPRQVLALAVAIALMSYTGCGDSDADTGDTSVADTSSPDVDSAAPDATDATASDGVTTPDVVTPAAMGVRFVTPTSDDGILDGIIAVALEPIDATERFVDRLDIAVNDTVVFSDTKLPTSFFLDTREHAGNQLRLTASGMAGAEVLSDAVDVTINNRPFRFETVDPDHLRVRDGQEITLRVVVNDPAGDVAVDFSSLDTAYSAGAETVTDLGGGAFRVTYRVSLGNARQDRKYRVPIRVAYPSWQIVYERLDFQLDNRPRLPLDIPGAMRVAEPMPLPTGGWTAPNPSLAGNSTIVTGGSATLDVDFKSHPDPNEVVGIIIGLSNYGDHLHIPLDITGGTEALRLLMRQFGATDPSPPASLDLRVALVDAKGDVSSAVSWPLDVRTVGAGDLQISVSWDSPTDVDLHVTGPGNCLVYFANKTCGSGGELDLDSNPGCSIDGINNENVFWDTSQASAGSYDVELRYWSDCSCCSARYTVTVVSCGSVETYEGLLQQGSSGGDSPKRFITSVDVADCGRALTGTVRYEDVVIDEGGVHARRSLPARYAKIEVRRASDGQFLAAGATDGDGAYRVQYPDEAGDTNVFVRVLSRTAEADTLRSVEVMKHPYVRDYYALDSPEINVSSGDNTGRDVLTVDLMVTAADGAGAFNIFDQLVTGHDAIRRRTGDDLGALRGFWHDGTDDSVDPLTTIYCSRNFYDGDGCIEPRSVTVGASDAFYDMPIMRGFAGFALEKVSTDDAPGGPADGRRVVPSQAWTHGAKVYVATELLGTDRFVEPRPFGVLLIDVLDELPSRFAFNMGPEGEISPWLVSALLWDFADATDEPFDPVDRKGPGIYDAIINVLGRFNPDERGPTGVDLTDFLDGFICRGHASEATLGPLLDSRGYTYDFAATCP